MNVLTTATDASAMPVAAGMASSRTRPDDWRVKRPWPVAALPPMGALVLAMLPLPEYRERKSQKERPIGAFQNDRPRLPRRQGRFIDLSARRARGGPICEADPAGWARV